MTREEAARILDPETSAEVLREYGDGNAQIAACDEACRIAADVLRNKPEITDHFHDITKMVPLTLEQLRYMLENDGEIIGAEIIVSENGVLSHGVLDCRSDDGICAVISASTNWLKEKDYGKGWLAYAYPPAHIDREELVSVEERLPEDEKDGETVLVIVFGKPHENITLHGAIMTASHFRDEGWVLNEYPEWEGPEVTHWMPLPEPPADLEKRMGVMG